MQNQYANRTVIKAQLRSISRHYPFTMANIETIFAYYEEEWRKYHNLKHVSGLFRLLLSCDIDLFTEDEEAALVLMIVYHDIIYRVGREKGWSENESAKLCEEHLHAAHWPLHIVDMTVCGIKATIDHNLDDVPQVWHKVVSVFLDLDLMDRIAFVTGASRWGNHQNHHSRKFPARSASAPRTSSGDPLDHLRVREADFLEFRAPVPRMAVTRRGHDPRRVALRGQAQHFVVFLRDEAFHGACVHTEHGASREEVAQRDEHLPGHPNVDVHGGRPCQAADHHVLVAIERARWQAADFGGPRC